MKNYVIATSRPWNVPMVERLAARLEARVHLIQDRGELSYDRLSEIKPEFVFFPHWSYLIPAEIHQNFKCVIFHMTDLPFGRGGSPLQNLIQRGITRTQISAIRCVAELDAGPIYLKRPLELHGTATEIFHRAGVIIEEMISEIALKDPSPVAQEGEVVLFQRRRPEDGSIADLSDLHTVVDFIRMLDADGYPKAFIETGSLKFEFSRVSFRGDHLVADVRISRKGTD